MSTDNLIDKVFKDTNQDKIDDTIAKTNEHINNVRDLLYKAIADIKVKAANHDQSKLESPELETFTEYTSKLKDLEYGSDEYKQCLADMKPALDHHYASNSHHPEHYNDGMSGMNLLDLVEMICDWMASARRHTTGDVNKSVGINQERFGYNDMMAQIFRNTIKHIDSL